MSESMVPKQTFYASGKLLITGEYLVLDGAEALAVPTRLGQYLHVEEVLAGTILNWQSFDINGNCWFSANFSREAVREFTLGESKDSSITSRLLHLLSLAVKSNPTLWRRGIGLNIRTELEFDRNWGLGSSSTLSYLIAAWSGQDAFDLNKKVFGGSGYDIACAGSMGPLVYELGSDHERHVTHHYWNPAGLEGSYLVHLNQKQNSRVGIENYRAHAPEDIQTFARDATQITQQLLTAKSREQLIELLRKHESLVGYVTNQRPLSKEQFADFPGLIKSLGAWGGDFVLALPESDEVDVPAYFAEHGLETCIPTHDLLKLDVDPLPIEPIDSADIPVFLYGPLSEPRRDNHWLIGHMYTRATLRAHTLVEREPFPTPEPGDGTVTGTLVYITPREVALFDVHTLGLHFVRTQRKVYVGTRPTRAQIWLPYETL